MVPAQVMNDLDQLSRETGQLGENLAKLQRQFEPIEDEYDNFISDYVTGLWAKHSAGEAKWPGEDVRVMLARKEMPAELYGRYTAHKKSIDRIEARLRSVRTQIDAKRSILSALKAEMEAAR